MKNQNRSGMLWALLVVVAGCDVLAGMEAPILDEPKQPEPPPSTCGNMAWDGNETDWDCGGDCDPCNTGKTCKISKDCLSLICKAGACEAPRCDDGVLNGDETDKDCGGSCAQKCDDGELCGVGEDCSGLVCTGGVCQVPMCGDGVVHSALGEECDDGDLIADHCDASCRLQEVVKIAAGYRHQCALLNDGSVKCWGKNEYGQLGQGDTNFRGDGPGEMGQSLPAINLGTGKTASAIAGGSTHTCALLNDGSVKCWGSNILGELGQGDKNNRGDSPGEMGDSLPAINLGTGKTASAIAAGNDHTCALLNDGSVKCWGVNGFGELGQGDKTWRGDGPGEMGDSLPAINLGAGKTASAIAAGGAHTCALLNDGSVKCWGMNQSGQLGQGTVDARGDGPGEMGDSLPAVSLGTGKTASAIAVGNVHTCAMLNDGSVKCWGDNQIGELGQGDTAGRGDGPGEMGDSLPAIDLGTGKTASAIVAGDSHSCALLNGGSVKCWGDNNYGQLGQGNMAGRGFSPGQMGNSLPAILLGTGTTASRIAGGAFHTCALLNDGSVKCWGNNFFGQLGLGDINDRGDQPNEMGDALPSVKLFSSVW